MVILDNELVWWHWGYSMWFQGFDLVYTYDWWGWVQ